MKTTDTDTQTRLEKETTLANTAPQQILKINNAEDKEGLIQENSKSPNMITGKSKSPCIINISVNGLYSTLKKFRLMQWTKKIKIKKINHMLSKNTYLANLLKN